jgi:hypothetical protein
MIPTLLTTSTVVAEAEEVEAAEVEVGTGLVIAFKDGFMCPSWQTWSNVSSLMTSMN